MTIATDIEDGADAMTATAQTLRALAPAIEQFEPVPVGQEVALSDRLRNLCDAVIDVGAQLQVLAADVATAQDVITPPPPPPPVGGWLDTATAGMLAGEFRQLDPTISWWQVVDPSNRTFWTVDWTPRMHWDAARQRFIKFGLRIVHRAVTYNGAWSEYPLPAEYTQNTTSGHWYGWSAHDGADRILAKDYLYDLATDTFTKIAPIPVVNNGANGTMCAWLASSGRFVRYGGDGNRWMEYDPTTNSWPVVITYFPHGKHALLEYNAVDDCCLMVGGNNTVRKASLVAPGGALTPLPDIPHDVLMYGGSWIVPLPEGGWIVRAVQAGDPRMWKISAANPVWEDVGPWPSIGIGAHSVAMVADKRLLLIGTTTGLHAYKL